MAHGALVGEWPCAPDGLPGSAGRREFDIASSLVTYPLCEIVFDSARRGSALRKLTLAGQA